MIWGTCHIRHCLSDYQYYPFFIFHSQVSRNPLRVSEVVHESSTRISVIVPGHPDSPSRGRTDNTNNICNGVLAELNNDKAACMPVYPTEKAGKIATSRKSLMAVQTGLPLVAFPLSKNVPFVQGIAFFKKRGSTMRECKQCPHDIGDITERDCAFPDCIGWHVERNQKPIPDRRHDYDFVHIDYDLDNGLCGTAENFDDAIKQILEIEAEKKGNQHLEDGVQDEDD